MRFFCCSSFFVSLWFGFSPSFQTFSLLIQFEIIILVLPVIIWTLIATGRAVFSFSNPGVFVVIAKLQKAEIRLRPFPEPPNSGGALAPPAPPLNTALDKGQPVFFQMPEILMGQLKWRRNWRKTIIMFRNIFMRMSVGITYYTVLLLLL